MAPHLLHQNVGRLDILRFEPKIVRTIVMLFAFEIAVMMRMSFPGDGGDDGTWRLATMVDMVISLIAWVIL